MSRNECIFWGGFMAAVGLVPMIVALLSDPEKHNRSNMIAVGVIVCLGSGIWFYRAYRGGYHNK
jgi:hypothetical protein